MKRIFVLDENVFIQSHTCRNIQNLEDDFESLGLIITILRKCHKIGLSCELKKKYLEKTKTLENQNKITHAIRLWTQLLSRSDKNEFCDNEKRDIPKNIQHDKHVINPTLFLSGILVTTDIKLVKRLSKWIEKQKLKLQIMSPKEAVKYLEEYRE